MYIGAGSRRYDSAARVTLTKVVELATVIAAPSCAAVLADFGAEVTLAAGSI